MSEPDPNSRPSTESTAAATWAYNSGRPMMSLDTPPVRPPLQEAPEWTMSRARTEGARAPLPDAQLPAMRKLQDGECLPHLNTSRLPPQLNSNAHANIYQACVRAVENESIEHDESDEAGGAGENAGRGHVASLFALVRQLGSAALPGIFATEGGQLGVVAAPSPAHSTRSFSSLHSNGRIPTFVCFICYDSVPLCDRYVPAPSAVSSTCPHPFCRPCIRTYLTSHTQDGMLHNSCPMIGAEGCELVYGEGDLVALVSEDVLKRYRRFVTMRANDNVRECPNPSCAKLVEGCPTRPAMVCDGCSTPFCFVHATAHPPSETCAMYARRTAKAERASRKAIRRISRPCPSCKAPTQKDGGCNHMRCSKCDHQWCWLCSRTYTDNHYAATNLMGCPGSQFLELEGAWGHYTAALMWIPRLSLLLVFFPLLLLLSLVSQALWLPLSLCLRRSGLFSRMKAAWFALPFLGALCGDTLACLLCGRILAFTFLITMLLPLQLMWLPLGFILGLVIITLKALGLCSATDLGSNGEVMGISCLMLLGLWGVAVESLGLLTVFGGVAENEPIEGVLEVQP